MTSEEACQLADEVADPDFIEKYAAIKRSNEVLSRMVRQESDAHVRAIAANVRLMQQINSLSAHNEKLRGMIRSVRAAISIPDGPSA